MGWVQGGHGVGMGCSTSAWHGAFGSFLPGLGHLQQNPLGSSHPSGAKCRGVLAGRREVKRCSAPGLVLLRPSQRAIRFRDALDKRAAFKEGFLETQRSCTGMSGREVLGAAAKDPLLAEAQDLFAGSLSHCLSYRFLRWKEKALAQRAASLNDGQSALPLQEVLSPRQPKWLIPTKQGDGGPCTGQ